MEQPRHRHFMVELGRVVAFRAIPAEVISSSIIVPSISIGLPTNQPDMYIILANQMFNGRQ